MSELSLSLLLPWLRSRLGEVAPRTVKRERGDLLVLWRFAHRRQWCAESPNDVPSIPIPKQNPLAWTIEEFSALLQSADGLRGKVRCTGLARRDYWRAFLLALYDTGARVNAMFCVSPKDVCLVGNPHIVLRPENAKTSLGQVSAISQQTVDALLLIFDPSRELVWPGTGKRSRFTSIQKLVKLAGLPEGRQSGFHRIRRTTVTQIVKHGSLDEAMRTVGHTSPAMTLRYVDRRQLLEASAVARLPRLPRPASRTGRRGRW
ncbi:MAG: site-specific integrase [Planctomycetaceae bacterium]